MKISLSSVLSTFGSALKINNNFSTIQTAFDNTLSRDGLSPNAMEATLDMNSHQIVNLPQPNTLNSAARLQDVMDAAGSGLTVTVGEGGGGVSSWNDLLDKPSTFPASQESVEDIVGAQIIAGANMSVSYNDITGKVTLDSTGGGGGASVIDSVADGDTVNAPSRNAVFDALALKADASSLATTNSTVAGLVIDSIADSDTTHSPSRNSVFDALALKLPTSALVQTVLSTDTTHVPSSDAVRTAINAIGGLGANMPNFVVVYAGVPDGVTNNDTAFTNAEAGAYQRIWLPEGVYLTTKTRNTLTKTYLGPGQIKTSSTRWLSGFSSYHTNQSWLGLTEYGQDAVNPKATEMSYHEVQPGTRVTKDERYFFAPSTPKFTEMRNEGGWSGISGLTNGAITAGATSCLIRGGVVGWNVGDVVSFVDVAGGAYTDTKTLTGASGSTISWTGGLTHSYADRSVVTHGIRTMNPYHLAILDHKGGGDAYLWCGRLINSYVPLASQTEFTFTSTVGLIGGDMTLTQDRQYGTGWEMSYNDSGKDVCMAAFVNSYNRTNNTGTADSFWIHDYVKCDFVPSVKPIDGIWVAAQRAQVGLDLSRSTFSMSNTAIALSANQRIDFNASVTYPGTGNGFIANTVGQTYVTYGNDGVTGYLDMYSGTSRLRLRDQTSGVGSFNCNVQMNCNAGVFGGTGGIAISTTGKFYFNGLLGDTYLWYTGSNIQLYKAGSLVQSW